MLHSAQATMHTTGLPYPAAATQAWKRSCACMPLPWQLAAPGRASLRNVPKGLGMSPTALPRDCRAANRAAVPLADHTALPACTSELAPGPITAHATPEPASTM
eukprot:jgi/Ulvmu1/829/UM010_0203.1